VTAFLRKLRRFNPCEALTRFGLFATLSNATQQAINRLKILEYGRYHRLPVFQWWWTTPVPADVYESEPSMWGYFCEGGLLLASARLGRRARPAADRLRLHRVQQHEERLAARGLRQRRCPSDHTWHLLRDAHAALLVCLGHEALERGALLRCSHASGQCRHSWWRRLHWGRWS
jgi:hypothetical protein